VKNKQPLISIVTVVYNGEQFLEKTIQSVINQSYENIEYIIIDGGSTDGTVDTIKKYEKKIDYWVSEKDGGIYDAMNKGIMAAHGEWVSFMNGGDEFFNRQTIDNVFSAIDESAGLIYGDTEIHYKTFVRARKADGLKRIKERMPFGHQSMFVKTSVHKNNLYNTNYTICADYDFVCTLYQKNICFERVNLLISSCSTDGVSDIQSMERTQQSAEIAYKHFPDVSIKFYHQKNIVRNYIKFFFKRVLPSKIVEIIKRLK